MKTESASDASATLSNIREILMPFAVSLAEGKFTFMSDADKAKAATVLAEAKAAQVRAEAALKELEEQMAADEKRRNEVGRQVEALANTLIAMSERYRTYTRTPKLRQMMVLEKVFLLLDLGNGAAESYMQDLPDSVQKRCRQALMETRKEFLGVGDYIQDCTEGSVAPSPPTTAPPDLPLPVE